MRIVLVFAAGILVGTAIQTAVAQTPRPNLRLNHVGISVKDLPEAVKPSMEDLILYEVQQHSERRKLRADRHISGSAVAAMIFVAAVTGGIGWGLAYLAVTFGWAGGFPSES